MDDDTPDSARARVLIAPLALADELDGPAAPIVLAVQSVNPYTGRPSERSLRVPGAIDTEAYEDFQSPSHPVHGQRPLPDPGQLQEAMRRWGLQPDRPVVVYDDDRSMVAARAWWVLRWAGLRDVRVLDGGLPAWRRAGLPLGTEPGRPVPSNIAIRPGRMPELGADDAALYARKGVLLDARIRRNYLGVEPEGEGPRKGHIPGAVSAPTHDVLTDEGDFAPSVTLAEHFRGLGVVPDRPVGVYCGAGMSAAHTVLALASLGIEAAMYPGSWSAWISDPARPTARGHAPG